MQDNAPCSASTRHQIRQSNQALLATIRTVFARTMAAGGSIQDITDHFFGRLDALARHFSFYAADSDGSVDLEQLVCEELRTFRFGDDPRIAICGAELRLTADAAQWVGLALHELVTNSIKFGALGEERSCGQVQITWDTDAQAGLSLDWQETGVAIVVPAPIPYGFGRNLIEDILSEHLGSRNEFTIRPGSITCKIRLPEICLIRY